MQENIVKSYVMGEADATARPLQAGRSQQLDEAQWRRAYADGEVVAPPYNLEALADLYETNPAHKACVDAKVTNIVGLGYFFAPATSGTTPSDSHLQLLNHLFNSCNPEMTFTEVMRAVWTDVECLGNGYLEVTRNSRGDIDGFYNIPAVTMRVRADRAGFVQIRDGQQRHFRHMGAAEMENENGELVNEVVHFSKYTPHSNYYGLPDIIPALPSILGDRAACEFNLDFFDHNAVPRLAIIVEGAQLSGDLLNQIQHYMESEIKGQAHKTLVLEAPGSDAKVRIEPLTVGGTDDAGFVEYHRQNRDTVLMVHRVPPAKVTIVEDANRANSDDQDKTFREQVVKPEQRRVEFRINRIIRAHMGISDWDFRFREMDLTEELKEAQVAEIYQRMGAWTIDEIRQQQGMKPLAERRTADTAGTTERQNNTG